MNVTRMDLVANKCDDDEYHDNACYDNNAS